MLGDPPDLLGTGWSSEPTALPAIDPTQPLAIECAMKKPIVMIKPVRTLQREARRVT
jgi:hypothetical protein